MRHGDFKIGLSFTCGGKRWRVTDVGTRVAVAIELMEDPSWNRGPPYPTAETVFDENDMPGCEAVSVTFHYAGFAFHVGDDGKLTAMWGQHKAAYRDKHLRAAQEIYDREGMKGSEPPDEVRHE